VPEHIPVSVAFDQLSITPLDGMLVRAGSVKSVWFLPEAIFYSSELERIQGMWH
jgi:hypothetical protein